MKTEVRYEGALTVVAVSESVDALTAPDLTRLLSEQIADGHCNLVVDLTRVEFMSSAGLRTLLGGVKEARTAGETGGRYLTARGTLRVLMVFASFPDDERSHPWWPAHQAPLRMREFLDPDTSTHSPSPFNLTGQPGISLPLHWTPDGLPVGAQLVAATGGEDLLLQVAAQLEQAAPWSTKRPLIHA